MKNLSTLDHPDPIVALLPVARETREHETEKVMFDSQRSYQEHLAVCREV